MQPGINPVTKLTESEYILYICTQETNFTMSNSTNPILLQEKPEVLRLQHLGGIPTQISEKIGRSADSVERILSQKGRITKCSSPNRSRKYLTLGDRLCVICRDECGDRHDPVCTNFNISIRTLQHLV